MRTIVAAVIAAWAVAGSAAAQPQAGGDPGGLGLRMDQCLSSPSLATAQAFATALHATAQAARTGPGPSQTRPDPADAARTLRTRVTVTAAGRWTFNHVEIEYREETYQPEVLETRTNRVISRSAPERTRACLVTISVDNAAAEFDGIHVSLSGPAYAVVLSAGRQVAFVRPPQRPGDDMNVVFAFEQPVALRLPAGGGGAYQLRVADAADTVLPPTAQLPEIATTRAALLAAMRGPARMVISNTITPPAGR